MLAILKVLARGPTDDCVFGIGLFSADGVCCYRTNTYLEEMNPQRLAGQAEATFTIGSLDLVEGIYKVGVAVHKRDGVPYDCHRLLYTFPVKSKIHDIGIFRPRHQWTFSPCVEFKTNSYTERPASSLNPQGRRVSAALEPSGGIRCQKLIPSTSFRT